LIVDGMQVFLIRQAVINIGRRADNHLVIDDARVSGCMRNCVQSIASLSSSISIPWVGPG